jgi:hypothetical protein
MITLTFRDRAGAHSGNGHDAVLLAQIFDAHLAVLDHALERLPHREVHEHIVGVDHQKPAVGPDARAGTDHGEVGQQGAELGAPLHAPEHVVVGGVGLDDHRSAREIRVVDQDVDPILQVGIRRRLQLDRGARGRFLLLRVLAEIVQVRQDVVLDLVQVGGHVREAAELLADSLDARAHHVHPHAPVELVDLLAALAVDVAHLAQESVDVLLQLGAAPLDLLLGRFVENLVLLGGDRLAVDDRHERDADLGELDGKSQGAGLLGQLVEEALLALLILLDQGVHAALVFLALEGLGDFGLQVFDQVVHLVLEHARLARRQAEGQRAVGVAEVVDVAPVVGGRHRRSDVVEEPLDHRGLAGAGQAAHVDVVARRRDVEPEADGAHRPLLLDEPLERRDLRRRSEGEHGPVAAAAQLLGRQSVLLERHGIPRIATGIQALSACTRFCARTGAAPEPRLPLRHPWANSRRSRPGCRVPDRSRR